MKKRVLFCALPVVAMLSFSSCDKDEDENQNDVLNENPQDSPGKDTKVEHPYVDLGLPSGTLWAQYNIGATKIGEYGDLFEWGQTKAATNLHYEDCLNAIDTVYNKYNKEDKVMTLFGVDDAATANWGDDWRMPTQEDFDELNNALSDYSCETINGVPGIKLIAKNGNWIFFPAMGCSLNSVQHDKGERGFYYTSSRIDSDDDQGAYAKFFTYVEGASGTYENPLGQYKQIRSYACSVRAVRVKK